MNTFYPEMLEAIQKMDEDETITIENGNDILSLTLVEKTPDGFFLEFIYESDIILGSDTHRYVENKTFVIEGKYITPPDDNIDMMLKQFFTPIVSE
jgi:hypothetical protein